MIYTPGTVGVCHSPGLLGKLIRAGEWLDPTHHRAVWHQEHPEAAHEPWYWNHAFVIVGADGSTIEAGSKGIVRNNVTSHANQIILKDPFGNQPRPDAHYKAVVQYAVAHLGVPYSVLDDVCLGVDCLTGWKLHDPRPGVFICSEFAAKCLEAGGWTSPREPVLMKPADLVWALS